MAEDVVLTVCALQFLILSNGKERSFITMYMSNIVFYWEIEDINQEVRLFSFLVCRIEENAENMFSMRAM